MDGTAAGDGRWRYGPSARACHTMPAITRMLLAEREVRTVTTASAGMKVNFFYASNMRLIIQQLTL